MTDDDVRARFEAWWVSLHGFSMTIPNTKESYYRAWQAAHAAPMARPADSRRVGDERQELLDELELVVLAHVGMQAGGEGAPAMTIRVCKAAIAALAAQGQGEPVAWQYRMLADEGWGIWRGIEADHLETVRRRTDCEVRALGVIGGAPSTPEGDV